MTAPAGYGDSLEGLHAVEAALAAGRVRELVVERRRQGHPEVDRLIRTAEQAGVDVRTVDDLAGMAVSAAPQGILARADPLRSLSLEGLVDRSSPAAVLVLDHVEDPHNVGAIARSAAAAGLTGLVMSVRRAAPLGPTAFKAAAGAFEDLPVALVSSVAEAVTRLSRLRVWVVGLEAGGSRSLFGLDLLTEPVALVVGAEGRGLSRLVRARADLLASIPMAPRAQSLNASVAAALAAFEVMRMRGGAPVPHH